MKMDPGSTYHDDRVPPQVRFDEVETTVSHLFRRPHPALQGRTFGEALGAAFSVRGLLAAGEVFELGAGAGFVAASLFRALPQPKRYVFLELSDRLIRIQRQQVPGAHAVRAHAERLPLRAGAIRGLFVANEVIADLRVLPAEQAECRALADRYGFQASRTQLLNVGAIRLVEELARVLAPGATACLTEFGGEQAASPVLLHGPLGAGRHVEHSIHFGQLEQVARGCGLMPERVLLADLLGVDRSVRVASYPDVLRLRRFVPRLPVLAHPKDELEARHPVLTRLFQFSFPEVGSTRFPDPRASGGFCQLFHALFLRPPAPPTPGQATGVR